MRASTRITRTPSDFGDRLIEPEYIDSEVTDLNTKYQPVTRMCRFTPKLHNTFMVNGMIIAVWVIDQYLGDVK